MDMTIAPGGLDEQRLAEFAGTAASDLAAAMGVLLAYMGDRTGIYRALRDTGRCDVATLAGAAGVDERYLLEWLSAQAAAGYVNYHPEDATFSLSPEQAIVLAGEGHPACVQGFAQSVVGQYARYETAVETLRSGAGRPWGEHHDCLFCGTDRFFRPGYMAYLVSEWLPARRRGRTPQGRRQSDGHRLRPRFLDDADGRGLAAVDLHRPGLPRPVDRGRAGVGRGGRGHRQHPLRHRRRGRV